MHKSLSVATINIDNAKANVLPPRQYSDDSHVHKSLTIATINIENVKTNVLYLEHLMENTDILLVQEHWLANFESSMLTSSKHHKFTIKCYDDNNPLPPTHRPRGRAGIAIIWKSSIDPAVTILPDGSNRLQVIQIATQTSTLTLVNTYMPTEGSLDQSTSYSAVLDEVYEVTQKYSSNSIVLWGGDINASLNRGKTTRNDQQLRRFLNEVPYAQVPNTPDQPTYHHFCAGSHSQIDHFFYLSCQEIIVDRVCIDERHPLNLSSHDPVVVELAISLIQRSQNINNSAESTLPRVNWKKINLDTYYNLTELKLGVLQEHMDEMLPTDIILQRFHDLLKSCAEEASTTSKRLAKEKTGKHNWPPHITSLAKQAKALHAKWKYEGSPDISSPSAQAWKKSKQQLRSAQRQLVAERRNLYTEHIELSSKSDSNKFFSLIKNLSRPANTSACMNFPLEPSDELQGWSTYFKKLATPVENASFNHEYQHHIAIKQLLLQDLMQPSQPLDPVDQDTVRNYIMSLKNNKAADAYGITSEHLKHGSNKVVEIMTCILNATLEKRTFPSAHKLGIVTPVHKKGKPAANPDSYRRITVTPTTGKVIEKHIQLLSKPHYDKAQNRQQRGFTKNASSTSVALILSEAVAEAKDQKIPMFVQFLDAKKAFDVVWHDGMLCSLHDQGIDGPLWQLHSDIYTSITSRVKWQRQLSPAFLDQQGLRQGGLTSADSFKTKANPFLNKVESCADAFKIGSISVGAPTCADDTALCSATLTGARVLTGIAESDSLNLRYFFSTTKSKIMIINPNRVVKSQLQQFPVSLCNAPIEESSDEVHLGITRTPDGKASATVLNRISAARRATYAMMGAGLHGLNGLNPKTSMLLIKIYIIPRLLHGLETMSLTCADKASLEGYYRSLLKQVQHMQQGTASSAVYLLIGALPIEGHLDLQILSLYNRAVSIQGSLERDILERQLAIKDLNTHSWIATVRVTLDKYQLPSAYNIFNYPRPKEEWKRVTKSAVYSHWEKRLKEEAATKSSLQYLHLPSCSIGTPHPVYQHLPTDPLQVVMASVKTKLMTSRYPLSATKCAGKKQSSLCPICGTEPENLHHFLYWCNAARSHQLVKKLTSILQQENIIYPQLTRHSPQSQEWYTQLILDPTAITQEQNTLTKLEAASRNIIFHLHHHRATSTGGGSCYTWARAIKKGAHSYM